MNHSFKENLRMKPYRCFALLPAIALCTTLLPAQQKPLSESERLIGAWHLVSLGEPGADGKIKSVPDLTGSLIYTRDGHMSVQIMYPPSQSTLSNDYVRNGYEASFGTYAVNETAHTVTHHVQGSITPVLIGKDLTRAYHFADARHLIIRSTRPDEHWLVIWQHD